MFSLSLSSILIYYFSSPIWCRLLIVGKKAARLTNYCWMLNEGIILTQMIVTALKRINMLKFYFIGWMLPSAIMIVYTVIHSRSPYDTGCWTKSMGYLEHIYNIPPIAFIIVSIVPFMICSIIQLSLPCR